MVCRSFWSALRWSGFTFARYSSIVLSFFVAESIVVPTELFPVVSSLQFRDVDLFHLKHRVHDAFGLLGVLLVQHVNQKTVGVTCHDRPNLSLSQPHADSSPPPALSFSQ